MRVPSKIGRAAWLFWAVFSLSPPAGWTQQSARPKQVLVLYWYDQYYGRNVEVARSLKAAVQSSAPGGCEFYSEYLESNRFPGENQSRFLRDFVRQKYAGRTIDVIVATSGASLDFLLKYRKDLFPDAPIIFTANERPSAAQLRSGAGATGVLFVTSYRKTLDLALKLHPRTKRVFIVSGTSDSGVPWETLAREDLRDFKGADVTYLTDLSLEDLEARLRALPERSIVLYVWQRLQNRQGNVLESRDVVSSIAPSVRVPIYGMSSLNVGRGIVGGYVWTLEAQVGKVAELILKVLNGARPADIPVENSPVVPMFDWRELQRWGIGENRLPPGSIIQFRELTFWQQYKGRIVAVSFVLVLQTILIGALLVERRRTRRGAAALARTRRVLQESEERFCNMADSAPLLIWVSGPDKLCTFLNQGWLTFTGRTLEQSIGNGWMECVHPDDVDGCNATFSSAFDSRSAFQLECRLRRADGEYRWLLSAGVPRFQPTGVFAGYIGSSLDITDLKCAQERALAGQKLETIGLLAGGIAHDFNNLLGGILTSAELALMERADGGSWEEEVVRIKMAAVCGAQIVRELMILGARDNPAFESVDCALLVREMSQVLKVSISKSAALKIELDEDVPMVHGNPAQIRQLVMNLVINASQAMGDRKGEIRIVVKRLMRDQSTPLVVAANLPQAECVQLEVADNGSGMTEEVQARIFDPFFTTKPAGRGLGLAVAQGVVHAHNGVIKVVSAPGSGTTFQLFLPSIPKEEISDRDRTTNTNRVADESLAGTVLVIEDEESLRVSVSKVLRRRGFIVIEAEDGNAGVDLFLANAERIDVVLLDMTLPGKPGRAVLDELQRIRPDVRVIITSAYPRNQVQNPLDELQSWGYIQKPYQVSELEKQLRKCSVETFKIAHTAD